MKKEKLLKEDLEEREGRVMNMTSERMNARVLKRQKRQQGNGGEYEIQKVQVITGTRQLEDFEYSYDVIPPPYEPKDLLKIIEESDSLKQNIAAMATNIAAFGQGIRYATELDYDKADDAVKKEADREWGIFERILKYINPIEGFKDIIEKMVIDRESVGWGTLEIIRNGKGEVAQIEYCRACNMRLSKGERSLVEVKQLQINETGEYEEVEVLRRFKKFAQMINGRKVYFKEFGDPRTMNALTGKYEECTIDDLATEIAYFPIHASYTDYGVPRWIGCLVNAAGSRASEILNFTYFENGRMIPCAITVDGGQLTSESIQQIREGKGINNAYKLLVLETTPYDDDIKISGALEKSAPRVSTKIQPLTSIMNEDALFQDYQTHNKEKIRDTFRLPPIYTGASGDYTRATADIAKLIAEEQIFIPERMKIMSLFNTIIKNEQRLKYVEAYLKGPKIGDPKELAQALEPYIKAGAVTPNMLIDALGELLGKTLESLPDEIGNRPFELVKLEYMKQQQMPNENIQKSQVDMITQLSEMYEILKQYIGDDVYAD